MTRPGSLRVCLAQTEVRPGRPADNAAHMLELVSSARADGADLIVFPEMAIPGYLIGDEWEHDAFLRECEQCGTELCSSARDIIVIFGNVGVDWRRRNEDGRVRKYNALFVAEDGEFVAPENGPYAFAIKALHPNYRQFDDSRHFFDLRKLALEDDRPVAELSAPVVTGDLTLGCVLCEDAWDIDYSLSPLQNMAAGRKLDLCINISSSPFTVNKNHKRNRVFNEQAVKLGCPLVYVNNVGIQNNGKTVFTFDGASCVYDGCGNQVGVGAPFAQAAEIVEIPLARGAAFGTPVELRDDTIADVYRALDYGTRRFMDLCGIKRVTVGISGGIDSSVVAAMYRRILEPQDLLVVNMPSQYNSPTTRDLARELAANLGCHYAEVPIEESVALTSGQVDGLPVASLDGRLRETLHMSGLLKENVQARDRSSRLLSALSGAFGGVFTCNGNKSEATVGYATLYGDLCGFLAGIGDLWKMEVYELARHLNADVFGREVIPQGTIDLTPSAELSAAQNVDEGKGDPIVYPYHDRLFASWVEWWNRTTAEEILQWYIDGTLEEKLGYEGSVRTLFESDAAFIADLERWWALYQGMGLAKRIQAPPVLAVKRRAFGFDHRESQMGVRYTRRYADLKRQLAPAGADRPS